MHRSLITPRWCAYVMAQALLELHFLEVEPEPDDIHGEYAIETNGQFLRVGKYELATSISEDEPTDMAILKIKTALLEKFLPYGY